MEEDPHRADEEMALEDIEEPMVEEMGGLSEYSRREAGRPDFPSAARPARSHRPEESATATRSSDDLARRYLEAATQAPAAAETETEPEEPNEDVEP